MPSNMLSQLWSPSSKPIKMLLAVPNPIVQVEMLAKRNISLIKCHLNLLVKPASTPHQSIRESLSKSLTLIKILKSWSQKSFSKDTTPFSRRTIRALVEQFTSKARSSLQKKPSWLVFLTPPNSSMSSTSRSFSQKRRRTTPSRNRTHNRKSKRMTTRRSENS